MYNILRSSQEGRQQLRSSSRFCLGEEKGECKNFSRSAYSYGHVHSIRTIQHLRIHSHMQTATPVLFCYPLCCRSAVLLCTARGATLPRAILRIRSAFTIGSKVFPSIQPTVCSIFVCQYICMCPSVDACSLTAVVFLSFLPSCLLRLPSLELLLLLLLRPSVVRSCCLVAIACRRGGARRCYVSYS